MLEVKMGDNGKLVGGETGDDGDLVISETK